ncbi:MAG: hypothetical protein ACI9E1_001209, partial [Cryomorphaceae bacterium]
MKPSLNKSNISNYTQYKMSDDSVFRQTLRQLLLTLLSLTVFGNVANGVDFLNVGFEGTTNLPTGWTQSQISGAATWKIQGGGGNTGGSNPSAAHGGTNNATLYVASATNNQSDLISPSFDTTGSTNISLTFWHTQTIWSSDQDELKVFYSINNGTNWTQLAHYTASVSTWTERTLVIPSTSANTRIKFEGNAKYGYGVCLDDILVSGINNSLSAVSVVATDNAAYEVNQDPGTWTITRTGNTTGAISVNFMLSSNATQGSDYNINTTSPISFAAGETTKVVTLTPVDDTVGSEGEEVATLTLTAGTGYVIGDAADDIAIYDDEGFDLNILVIGSSKDSGERHSSSVSWNSSKPAFTPTSKPFSPTEISNQLRNILEQDNRGSVNVTVTDRYGSQAIYNGWTAYSYNLSTWFHYPFATQAEDPAENETNRWSNLRSEAGTEWDYVVVIGDPYTMEYTPGVYSLGVAKIAEEVAKGSAELVVFMPWQGTGSSSSVNHYKEMVYRTARSGDHKVAPGALAWQACGSPSGATHPNSAGAYIAAASIYSSIYNQSAAASGYVISDANANTTFTTYTANNTVSQYTGKFSFQNPYLILDDKMRHIRMSERGTSTEQGFKGKIKSAMDRSKVTYTEYNDGSYTNNIPTGTVWTTNPMPISFNYGRDGFYSEDYKSYLANPAYWQLGFGYYYQNGTAGFSTEIANDSFIGLMQMQDNDLANRMINEAPIARNLPTRSLWAQIHKEYPTLNPMRDSAHLSYNWDEAVGTYLYTIYSGRCPLDPKPVTDDIVWTCRKIGYETAWLLGRCQTRAPGFKVSPSAANKKSITDSTTETMRVEFILPPTNDVTVTVSSSNTGAAIVSPKTLIFTPQNYNIPQYVTVAGIPRSSAS